ncbi:hypothetical protein ACFWPK_20070 [Nocardia sp. NPDC058519]|uniref:hypothetical protein n=1 Tax=Nocardia sp. NPDC058519 TaxID=3346535 RepID=UPI003659E07D
MTGQPFVGRLLVNVLASPVQSGVFNKLARQGPPNDKNSTIEPHVEAEYLVLKNAQNRSWAKPILGMPQEDK